MTIYACPICNAQVRDNRGARLTFKGTWASDWPGLVCPNGHRVTKVLKRARRLWRVQARATAIGMTEADYRAWCRAEDIAASRWKRSPLFVGEDEVRAAAVVIGGARRKQ